MENGTSKKQMSAYALIIAIISGGGGFAGFTAAVDVADARWMTHEQHAMNDLKAYIRELKKEIRNIEYDKAQGVATEKQLWKLDRLYEDLEKAQDELG